MTSYDIRLEVVPWEPDDMGGGFPAIQVEGLVYDEKGLDKLILELLKKRKGLRRELKRACLA